MFSSSSMSAQSRKSSVESLKRSSLLYKDAQNRTLRQKEIYSKMLDKECTFTPNLENTKKWNEAHSEKTRLFEKLSCSSSRERSQLMLANS